ncbi:MAG: response regulator [Desulfobacter sp.]|nr:MAG: response regulator [Desulfobacter sp.]
MTDDTRSKQELINELNALRKENQELKKAMDTSGQEKTAPPPRTQTILIVDDNEDTRSIVADMLDELGYASLSAATAQEARDCIRTAGKRIGLVISDIVMPGEDGPDMMKEILAVNPDIKVIFMSGYAEDEIVHDSVYKIQDTAAAFMKKPFTLEELESRVAAQLGE